MCVFFPRLRPNLSLPLSRLVLIVNSPVPISPAAAAPQLLPSPSPLLSQLKLVPALRVQWQRYSTSNMSSGAPLLCTSTPRHLPLPSSPTMGSPHDVEDPHCGVNESLCSKGLYKRVRLMVDVRTFYYLAGKYVDCRACAGTFISWDQRMLQQLTGGDFLCCLHTSMLVTRLS